LRHILIVKIHKEYNGRETGNKSVKNEIIINIFNVNGTIGT